MSRHKEITHSKNNVQLSILTIIWEPDCYICITEKSGFQIQIFTLKMFSLDCWCSLVRASF